MTDPRRNKLITKPAEAAGRGGIILFGWLTEKCAAIQFLSHPLFLLEINGAVTSYPNSVSTLYAQDKFIKVRFQNFKKFVF